MKRDQNVILLDGNFVGSFEDNETGIRLFTNTMSNVLDGVDGDMHIIEALFANGSIANTAFFASEDRPDIPFSLIAGTEDDKKGKRSPFSLSSLPEVLVQEFDRMNA